jgi:hypothetical protein
VPVGRRRAGRRILWATHKQERAPPMISPGGLAAPSVLPQMTRATGDKRSAGSLVGPGRCPLYVRAQLDTVGLSWTPWDLVWLKAIVREAGKTQLTSYFRWWWQVLGSNQRRLSRRFYRPLPLAARATCRMPSRRTGTVKDSGHCAQPLHANHRTRGPRHRRDPTAAHHGRPAATCGGLPPCSVVDPPHPPRGPVAS